MPEAASAEEIFDWYNGFLNQELLFKRSLKGLHRDDLEICLAGRASKQYASQGQSRSIVLSLKLAVLKLLESELSESPVILLDDVDSELDSERRDYFFSMIFKQKHQIFISGVSPELFNYKIDQSASLFKLEAGSLEKQTNV